MSNHNDESKSSTPRIRMRRRRRSDTPRPTYRQRTRMYNDYTADDVKNHEFYVSGTPTDKYTCSNSTDPITMEDFVEADLIYIIYTTPSGKQVFHCFDRHSLFEWFHVQPELCIWTDDQRRPLHPIHRVYSLPTLRFYLTSDSLNTIKRSMSNVFTLNEYTIFPLGNVSGAHGVGNLHGEPYMVYVLRASS